MAPGMRIAAAWGWRVLVVIALVAVICFLIVQLRFVAIPVAVAILLSALLVPFSHLLQERLRFPRWLAVVTCLVALVVVVGGLVTLVVFQVRAGLPDLLQQTSLKLDELKQYLLASPLHLTDADIDRYLDLDTILETLGADTGWLLTGALEVGSDLGHVVAGALIAIFTTVFILIDGRGMWQWFVKLFPQNARAAIVGAGEAGWITLTSFVTVQVLVAAVDAVFIGLGAFILGMVVGTPFPLVIPIAILVFLASFIPVVGAVLSGAIAVFVALIYLGPVPALVMLGIVILVQQVEGHVLQPFLVGHAVKIHPVAIVLAVAVGGFVGGIAGALFAVPLTAVLNVVIGYIARGEWRTNPHPTVADVVPPTRGRVRAE
ncbi:MAG: AI-2E family transporter [Microbacteriaceae bacterium]|nr:AI-2E family transporter [Microbacteriaceae bacterium]